MITLENDMPVADKETLRVAAPSGEYNDAALIECYDSTRPEMPRSTYQAQFIKYGDLVYRFSDAKELGAEILKHDPDSTHTAAVFVRISNELLAQMNEGSLQPTSLEDAQEAEQTVQPEENEKSVEEPTDEQSTESETIEEPVVLEPDPEDSEAQVLGAATSTDPVLDDSASTTTPALPEETQNIFDPVVQPEVDVPETETTTPEIAMTKLKRRQTS